mmetsp:Transcript_22614/g.69556  ORF Transcript_22614/g.69556 Transcript_22614/m.69556 type:complete len:262 (+) Transcript_22614:37-822(+)
MCSSCGSGSAKTGHRSNCCASVIANERASLLRYAAARLSCETAAFVSSKHWLCRTTAHSGATREQNVREPRPLARRGLRLQRGRRRRGDDARGSHARCPVLRLLARDAVSTKRAPRGAKEEGRPRNNTKKRSGKERPVSKGPAAVSSGCPPALRHLIKKLRQGGAPPQLARTRPDGGQWDQDDAHRVMYAQWRLRSVRHREAVRGRLETHGPRRAAEVAFGTTRAAGALRGGLVCVSGLFGFVVCGGRCDERRSLSVGSVR